MAFEGGLNNSVGLVAAADLSAKQFTFCTLAAGKVTANTAAGGVCAGVLQDKPSAAGEAATLALVGSTTKVVFGATVAAGAAVMSDANGKAITATSTNHAMGYCIIGGDANEIGTIVLTGGYTVG